MKIAFLLAFLSLNQRSATRPPLKTKQRELTRKQPEVNYKNTGFIDCLDEDDDNEGTTFEDLLCITSYKPAKSVESSEGNDSGSVARKMMTVEAENLLQGFIDRLPLQAYKAAFDSEGFEKTGWILERDLHDMRAKIERYDISSPVLEEKLSLAERTLWRISTSLNLMTYFRELNVPGHNILWQVLVTNVKLLQLQQSVGSPGTSIFLSEAIELSREYLKILDEVNLPYGVHVVFKAQQVEAFHTLQILDDAIPGITGIH